MRPARRASTAVPCRVDVRQALGQLCCDEVFKRNPHHFGALSGAGQIHLQLGHTRIALEFFRRAVKVNPNLAGPAQMSPLLERKLEDEDKNKTRCVVRRVSMLSRPPGERLRSCPALSASRSP